eukprot:g17217.t1
MARSPVPTAVETPTVKDQNDTVELVLDCFRAFLEKTNSPSNTEHTSDDSAIKILRDKHLKFLHAALFRIPQQFSGLDASRPWFVFWIIHALELLKDDEFLDTEVFQHKEQGKNKVCQFLLEDCFNSPNKPGCSQDGGFGGGPRQLSHLATTYASIAAVCIACGGSGAADGAGNNNKRNELLSRIDRPAIYRFLLSRKDPETGGFSMHDEGELDMRGTYCAIAVASMLQILTPELAENVGNYVKSHQSWDGGISGEPGLEAHGGYSYCGFSALCILGVAHEYLDVEKFLNWLVHRQMQSEGGYQGRTNKLVDSCYSFWQGSSFGLVRVAYELMHEKEKARANVRIPELPAQNNWTIPEPLQMYVFLACQNEQTGGLRDKPGKKPDFYHTCYSLSGVSACQSVFSADGSCVKAVVGDVVGNTLREIDPFYNVGLDKSFSMFEYFAGQTSTDGICGAQKFVSPTKGEEGGEGAGVSFWRKRFMVEDGGGRKGGCNREGAYQ